MNPRTTWTVSVTPLTSYLTSKVCSLRVRPASNSFFQQPPLLICLCSLICAVESIDALALAVQQFKGGVVLVSHDMRLISQVAKEIWICEHKTVEPYQGDISRFKMDMRVQMGIDAIGKAGLRGDASQKAKEGSSNDIKKEKKLVKQSSIEVVKHVSVSPKPTPPSPQAPAPGRVTASAPNTHPAKKISSDAWGSDDDEDDAFAMNCLAKDLPSNSAPVSKYIPPHLRNRR